MKYLINKALQQKLLDEGYLETYGVRGITKQCASEKVQKRESKRGFPERCGLVKMEMNMRCSITL